MTSTIDPQEVEKFSAMAEQWWDLEGKFKPLHKFNPIRIKYLKNQIIKHFDLDDNLEGIEILDVGCGGGLISEPFAQMKAKVKGIDASDKNIAIAKLHAKETKTEIDYEATSSDELVKIDKQYDVVFALEIIEHVADVKTFIKNCAQLVKPGGLLFIATLNRTAKSLLLAKIGAEYILRWLPRGTHDWNKFLKPSEINTHADKNDLDLNQIMGFSYNLFKDEWKMDAKDLDVNYIMMFEKH